MLKSTLTLCLFMKNLQLKVISMYAHLKSNITHNNIVLLNVHYGNDSIPTQLYILGW